MILALLSAAVLQAPPADGPFDSWQEAKTWVEATAGGVTGGSVEPHFVGDGAVFTYRVTDADGAVRTVRVDPAAGTKRVLPPGAAPEPDAFGGYGVERLSEPRRSGGSRTETHVTFRNDTAGPRPALLGQRRRHRDRLRGPSSPAASTASTPSQGTSGWRRTPAAKRSPRSPRPGRRALAVISPDAPPDRPRRRRRPAGRPRRTEPPVAPDRRPRRAGRRSAART